MNLAGVDREIYAFENVPAAGSGDADVEIVDFKQWHVWAFFGATKFVLPHRLYFREIDGVPSDRLPLDRKRAKVWDGNLHLPSRALVR